MTASLPTPGLDVATARRRFPGLAVDDWVLADAAGGSQILDTAVERVADSLVRAHVQAGGLYPRSRLAEERVAAATAAWAGLLGAADPAELVWGASSTQLLANLSRAFEAVLQPGDQIVVTDVDHESNVGPWLRLAERGAELLWWRLDRERMDLDVAQLARLVGPRTRLVVMPQVSNLLGHLHDVAGAAELTRAAGVDLLVDGVACAPHRPVNLATLGATYYVLSVYKVYGPHQALLWGRRERLLALGNVNHAFIPRDKLPTKLAPGGACFELVHGASAVPEYLAGLGPGGLQAVAEHETRLAERLLGYLRSRSDVRILGRPDGALDRLPTVSFVSTRRPPAEVVARAAAHQVALKHGDFYAPRLCEALEVPGGVVRASLVHYNTLAEVDRILAALDDALA